MADIKQAAKWMDNGASVRRRSTPSYEIYAFGGIKTLRQTSVDISCEAILTVSDLLAEDWEIAE